MAHATITDASEATGQSLIEFFSAKKNRALPIAKRALLLAVSQLKSKGVVPNLCAASVRVTGTGLGLRIHLADLPAGRSESYEDPRTDSKPWEQNQYALAVSFHEALQLAPLNRHPPRKCRSTNSFPSLIS